MAAQPPEGTRHEACWVCGSADLALFRESKVVGDLRSEAFRITDSRYGVTGRLLRCGSCEFIQTADPQDIIRFYQELEDPEYEATREQRALQARKILEWMGPLPRGTRLLDVGAGSGILVEQAIAAGCAAEGVEPSTWLVQQAAARGLPVRRGVLPHPDLRPGYDVVTLVDVIEHVTDPLALLAETRRLLRPGGRVLVITPDVGSLAARLFRTRWWHFRVAHVGYFNRHNLDLALGRAGFALERATRPSWYFPVSYLWERAASYAGLLSRLRLPSRVGELTVPLNLFDSIAATYRLADR